MNCWVVYNFTCVPANVKNLLWYKGGQGQTAKKLRAGKKTRGTLQIQLVTSSLRTERCSSLEAVGEPQFAFSSAVEFAMGRVLIKGNVRNCYGELCTEDETSDRSACCLMYLTSLNGVFLTALFLSVPGCVSGWTWCMAFAWHLTA